MYKSLDKLLEASNQPEEIKVPEFDFLAEAALIMDDAELAHTIMLNEGTFAGKLMYGLGDMVDGFDAWLQAKIANLEKEHAKGEASIKDLTDYGKVDMKSVFGMATIPSDSNYAKFAANKGLAKDFLSFMKSYKVKSSMTKSPKVTTVIDFFTKHGISVSANADGGNYKYDIDFEDVTTMTKQELVKRVKMSKEMIEATKKFKESIKDLDKEFDEYFAKEIEKTENKKEQKLLKKKHNMFVYALKEVSRAQYWYAAIFAAHTPQLVKSYIKSGKKAAKKG